MNEQLAANILHKAKAVAPDRLPQPSREVAQVWAEALSGYGFPAELWSEAVALWAATLESERMATPREFIKAALAVRDRWEADPAKARVLDELRVARANANYLRAGLEPIGVEDLPSNAAAPAVPGGERGGLARLGELPIRRPL